MKAELNSVARVHRFRDTVAISAGLGETVYLTVNQARQLTRAINKINRSIERESYGESSDLTKEVY